MAKKLQSEKELQLRLADMIQSFMETHKKHVSFMNDIKSGKIKFAFPDEKPKAIQQKKK